jgi:hypothetical protein
MMNPTGVDASATAFQAVCMQQATAAIQRGNGSSLESENATQEAVDLVEPMEEEPSAPADAADVGPSTADSICPEPGHQL